MQNEYIIAVRFLRRLFRTLSGLTSFLRCLTVEFAFVISFVFVFKGTLKHNFCLKCTPPIWLQIKLILLYCVTMPYCMYFVRIMVIYCVICHIYPLFFPYYFFLFNNIFIFTPIHPYSKIVLMFQPLGRMAINAVILTLCENYVFHIRIHLFIMGQICVKFPCEDLQDIFGVDSHLRDIINSFTFSFFINLLYMSYYIFLNSL